MAMFNTRSGSISSGGGGGYHIVTRKRTLEEVKEILRIKEKAKWYLYFLIHKDLEEHPETIVTLELASVLGKIIKEKGWVFAPMEEGFENMRNELLNLKFQKNIRRYLKNTSDVSLIIHEFPLALYQHYPDETIKPSLVLKFPSVQKNLNNYLEIFSCMTYLINNDDNLIQDMGDLFKTKKNIIDCSSDMNLAIRSKFLLSYRNEFLKAATETSKKIRILNEYRQLELNLFNKPKRPKSNLNSFALGLVAIQPPEERDKKMITRERNRILTRITAYTAGVVAFLAGLAEFVGINLLELIQKMFGN